jgi:hypothetical protein
MQQLPWANTECIDCYHGCDDTAAIYAVNVFSVRATFSLLSLSLLSFL